MEFTLNQTSANKVNKDSVVLFNLEPICSYDKRIKPEEEIRCIFDDN